MKLLQTLLKVPYFEKHFHLNKKEPAEGLMFAFKNKRNSSISIDFL